MFDKAIGKRIRELREEKRMSREELASKAEISAKFLYEIENGKKGLSAKTLLKLSKALSCSCDYIMRDEHDMVDNDIKEQMRYPKDLTDKQLKLIEDIFRIILKM